MSKKRLLVLFLVLGLVVLVAVGSWIAGASIKSPAEVAARTAPPEPSPILVPVEKRVLSSDIITRGTARFGLPQSISIVPSGLKPDTGVIATLPLRNTQLNEGEAMFIASGRPIFVVQGDAPVFRDLVPGISGDDVRQLELALQRLGFDPGPVDGTYDRQTSAAVADWYSSSDWQPFGATPDQLEHIRGLEHELAVAINDKFAANDAVATAVLAVDAALAEADSTDKGRATEVAAMTAARDKIMARPTSTHEERSNADADLEVAQAMAKATQLAGGVAVQAAVDARKAAEREAKLADGVATLLAADLETAQSKAGVQVPADEIVFIPSLPVRVEQIDVVVGDTASGPVIMVTNNQLSIDSSLALDEAPLVRPGMAVAIDEQSLGIKATGVIERVANTPGTFGVDGFHIYFEIRVDKTDIALEGFSLRLTIPIESTGGKVTTVPVSALSLSADGTSRVQVQTNGTLEFIPVEPGLSAKGYVAVTPLAGTLAPGQLVVIGFEKK